MGSRRMMKQLHKEKEGFCMGRYRERRLMKKLELVVKLKRQLILTTDSKELHPVALNILSWQLNPSRPN